MLNRTKKAFTLLELIVVLLVLGILAAIAVPTFATVKQNAAERTFQTSAEAIARNATAIAASTNDGNNSVSPADVTAALAEVTGITAGDGDSVIGTVGGYSCTAVIQPGTATSFIAGPTSCTSN